MFCFHYLIFFCFFNCKILQSNAFDEEQNDIFAELWQKREEIGTKSGKCEETLQTNLKDNLFSQKIGKIKKEIGVKDEPNDYDEFDQFSNERKQKIALNKTVKEENVEKRVKSEFMEFDRNSDKEEFDNGKDGEEQRTDSYSIFDNSNLKENSSKSQKGIKKNYSEVEKQEIIAEFDELKNEFKIRAKGMFYDMKKLDEKIAQKLGVAIRTIYRWKNECGAPKTQKKHTDVEKVQLLKNFHKIKKENPQLCNDKIAQMLNLNIKTLYSWKRKSKGLKPGVKKIYSEVEKQEKIAEFDQLKKEFKSRVKGMSYDMKKVNEKKIAQKLEVTNRTIYSWKNEFGAPEKQKNYTDVEKVELLKNFHKIKKEYPQLLKYEIAQMLKLSIKTLYSWQRKSKGSKPGVKKIYSEVEKQEIIAEFDELKKEFKTMAKGMSYDMKKLEEKIAQKLKLSRSTIYNWKSKIGVKFPIKINSSERSTSSTNSLNDIPWKWNDFGKKRNERI